MKIPLLLSSLSLLLSTGFGQIYEIPDASEQPAWVFPFFVEDGTGAKDTIYVAYDPEAEDWGYPTSDTIFNEQFQSADTSKFFVYWDYIYDEGIFKVFVFKHFNPLNMGFNKAKLPVKITWDNTLFYSDSLPWKRSFLLPKAWAIVYCGDIYYDGCQDHIEGVMVITDIPTYDSEIFKTDSLYFESDYTEYFNNGLGVEIVPYGYYHDFIDIQSTNPELFYVSPNPAKDYITVVFPANNISSVRIINNIGAIVLDQQTLIGANQITLDTNTLSPGLYWVSVADRNNATQLKPIVIE